MVTDMVESSSVSLTSRNDGLKLFAIVTMLIDHIGYMYFPDYLLLRSIGRLSFPIFAYQVAIGYDKTSDLKRYMERLFIFGIIAQMPYAFFSPTLDFEPFRLNIMFTLLLALLFLHSYEMTKAYIKTFLELKSTSAFFKGACSMLAGLSILIIPEVISYHYDAFSVSYGIYGILLVFLFHLFKDHRFILLLSYMVLSVANVFYLGSIYMMQHGVALFGKEIGVFEGMKQYYLYMAANRSTYEAYLLTLAGPFFQSRSIFSLIAIEMLQKIEANVHLNKFIGYGFYPLHILVLIVVQFVLIR